jgi:site-specific DNA-methyltransferase (adenine-specific)
MKNLNIFNQDCLEGIKQLTDNSVDLLCTDPPYAINFMGKNWDKALPSLDIFKECHRVMKPGAFAFVMSSVRSDVSSRMTLLLEKAGFDISFSPIYWTYSSGFPKGYNMGQSAEKKLTIGSARRKDRDLSAEKMTRNRWGDHTSGVKADTGGQVQLTTPEARKLKNAYGGFQPKPAVELVIVAMKPKEKKTYVEQALDNNKAVTWLGDCKVPGNDGDMDRLPSSLSVSDDVLGEYSKYFDLDSWWAKKLKDAGYEDASKIVPFLEVKKPNKKEKEKGLDSFEEVKGGVYLGNNDEKNNNTFSSDPSRVIKKKKNSHPTVKPVKLFSYLITMGCSEEEVVLDPFMGSGTSGISAMLLNRKFYGFEIDEKYFEISKARIKCFEDHEK